MRGERGTREIKDFGGKPEGKNRLKYIGICYNEQFL